MKPLSKKKQQEMVGAWNKRFPVGTEVEVRKLDNSRIKTVTTSEAWMLGGHSAVIMLRDISGCYALRYVRAL